MDVTVIVAIASGITGLVVAVLTHIKHSECWGMKVDTTADTHNLPAQEQLRDPNTTIV